MNLKRTRRTRTRATTEPAKTARRESLLAAASTLFASRDFDEVSVDDIATRARVAKGTVYLYFGTKEALFLGLVAEEMTAWLRASGETLGGAEANPAKVAATVATTLSERPALVRLLALLHAVLERNSDKAALRAFKLRLGEITTASAALFERALGLAPGSGIRLTLTMHAVIVGLAQMTTTCPAIEEVLADDALAMFRLDFRTELEGALTTLFTGAQGLTAISPRTH